MARTSAGRLFRRMAIPVAIVGGLSIVAMRPLPLTPLAEARRDGSVWAKANVSSLPSTLTEMSSLSMVKRQAAMRELPVSKRAAVWEEHLNSFVLPLDQLTPMQRRVRDEAGPLNDAQVQLIRYAIAQLPLVFAHSPLDSAGLKVAAALCDSVKKVFAIKQSLPIFQSVGPIDSSYLKMLRPNKPEPHPDSARHAANASTNQGQNRSSVFVQHKGAWPRPPAGPVLCA